MTADPDRTRAAARASRRAVLARRRLAAAEDEIAGLRAALAHERDRVRRAEAALAAHRASTSWRLTAPLRRLVALVPRRRS